MKKADTVRDACATAVASIGRLEQAALRALSGAAGARDEMDRARGALEAAVGRIVAEVAAGERSTARHPIPDPVTDVDQEPQD